MSKKILLLLLLLLAVLARAEVTHLVVQPLTSAEQQYAVSQIGKITFADGAVLLFDKAGVLLGSTPAVEIGKILFGSPSDATSADRTNDLSLQIYPNPAQEILIARGLPNEQTVRIYTMQGQLVQSAVAVGGEAQLSIGSLQGGTYLLQAGAQIVKFIKE